MYCRGGGGGSCMYCTSGLRKFEFTVMFKLLLLRVPHVRELFSTSSCLPFLVKSLLCRLCPFVLDVCSKVSVTQRKEVDNEDGCMAAAGLPPPPLQASWEKP